MENSSYIQVSYLDCIDNINIIFILKSINNSLIAANCRIQVNLNTAINGNGRFFHGLVNGNDIYIGNLKWSYNLHVSQIYINRVFDGFVFSINFTKTEFLW